MRGDGLLMHESQECDVWVLGSLCLFFQSGLSYPAESR